MFVCQREEDAGRERMQKDDLSLQRCIASPSTQHHHHQASSRNGIRQTGKQRDGTNRRRRRRRGEQREEFGEEGIGFRDDATTASQLSPLSRCCWENPFPGAAAYTPFSPPTDALPHPYLADALFKIKHNILDKGSNETSLRRAKSNS